MAILVMLLIKIYPLLKMIIDPMTVFSNVLDFIDNEKILKCINWIHAKMSETLKKWWLKIQ